MRARGIPEKLVRWIGSFCSNRTASILVNGHLSETQTLHQAGLPQGSPLSPICYIFFNADLVQRRIDANGGAIAFVDDFTAWVTGPTAHSNRDKIKAIVEEALDWEKRSGATFETDKTAIIHFTRNARKADAAPVMIRGQAVMPKNHVKILGVIMDSRLNHGTETTERTFFCDSETTIYIHGGSAGRLRVKCVDARISGQISWAHQPGSESGRTSDCRDISHGRDCSGRGGGQSSERWRETLEEGD
ncbi:putative RNA-directed DNA polymerase from transposo n X-element [Beauveria bassiana D1-5]|uniref:Putative RNA-directed DNA polymerase from transposo n X-element n=1 Tax=Beauveria bassiana D1-5 TaxID=1245745 RepID=A0A0A2V941_BEABA|nr:putative RNA-directed DNA polymerase from transposo n X-element [Beauveria bassiana D1-5]